MLNASTYYLGHGGNKNTSLLVVIKIVTLSGIKTQTYRMDMRTWGGGRVSWEEVREWHRHIYTTKCKIDS